MHPLKRCDDVELYQKFRFRREDILGIIYEVQETLQFSNRLAAVCRRRIDL